MLKVFCNHLDHQDALRKRSRNLELSSDGWLQWIGLEGARDFLERLDDDVGDVHVLAVGLVSVLGD